MSQHDYIIADAAGSAFLADLNLAVKALAENNYGTTEPTVMYAHMWWADTTNDILKKRNAANTGWISYLTLSTGAPLVTSGTWSGNSVTATNLSNRADFYAYVGTTHTITSGGYTKVQLGSELFDVSSRFDAANYKFVAGVAGYYKFSWNVQVQGSAANKIQYAHTAIYKNGAAYSLGSGVGNLPVASAVDNVKSSGSTLMHLSVGEYAELYAYLADISGNGTALQGAAISYLCGHLEAQD